MHLSHAPDVLQDAPGNCPECGMGDGKVYKFKKMAQQIIEEQNK